MASQSPPTERVVRVLDLLATHPEESMGFTDIARRLQMSRATCHAVLATLTAAGYVLRTSDKMYMLGPSLVAVGRAAERSFPNAPEVREMIADLAERSGMSCVLTATNGESLITLGYEGHSHRGDGTRAGNRIPFAAPFGVLHAAWATAPAVLRWRQRGAEMGAGVITDIEQLLLEVRSRGFSISPLDKERRRLWELFELVQRDLLSDDLRDLIARSSGPVGRDYLWHEIEAQSHVAVSSISAPIFAAAGRISQALHLEVLDESLEAAKLRALIEDVVHTAARASELIISCSTSAQVSLSPNGE